jgi:signal transduction histidine kinase
MLLQMQGLVENLLLLARAEGGQLTLRVAEVEVGELVRECWAMHEARARERGLAVAVDIADRYMVHGDREFLRIVINNLLDNAVSYANNGGRVQVSVVREDSKVMVRVSNTGSTLTARELPQVFERFWRKEMSRSQTGLHAGLGLSLSQRLMVLQGGELRVMLEGESFIASAAMEL